MLAPPDNVDEVAPATGGYRQRAIRRMAQRADEIDYWRSVYADQQTTGIANSYSRDTIAKGDEVQYRGHWYTVVRANPKTVSVRLFDRASWTNKIGYHEISNHRRPL